MACMRNKGENRGKRILQAQRGFLQGHNSSIPADVSIWNCSLWWPVFLFNFQYISNLKLFFFLMLLMQLICCLLGSHLCFSEKRKHRLSLNQTETLKPLPDTCYPPGRSPIKFFSGLSCFDVNASSAYPNEELRPKGLSVFCKIQTLHCLVKYQAYLLKSC